MAHERAQACKNVGLHIQQTCEEVYRMEKEGYSQNLPVSEVPATSPSLFGNRRRGYRRHDGNNDNFSENGITDSAENLQRARRKQRRKMERMKTGNGGTGLIDLLRKQSALEKKGSDARKIK